MTEAYLRAAIREICRDAECSRVWIAGDTISAVAGDGRAIFLMRAMNEPWRAFAFRIAAALPARRRALRAA